MGFRSQAIYGCLVETAEPYFRRYTKNSIDFYLTLKEYRQKTALSRAKPNIYIIFLCNVRLYSHSIVEGGFDVMSYTTRLTPSTSLTMRLEMRSNTSKGMRAQSAVIPSTDVTARTPTV